MNGEKKHSLLSPSSAGRWIRCPPSARLSEKYPDTSSIYADEGTMAHNIAENKLRYTLGLTKTLSSCSDIDMDKHTNNYVKFILSQMNALSKPNIYIEQKVDCSKYIRECSGTCDALIISDNILHIIDLKYGAGIIVQSQNNEQLKIYALGALEMLSMIYSVSIVRLSVFQPRLNNISTWEISRESLEIWANEILKPAAELAWHGHGDCINGAHCQFCRAKRDCKAYTQYNSILAAQVFM